MGFERMARMMTVKKMGNIDAMVDQRGGQLVCVTSPTPREE